MKGCSYLQVKHTVCILLYENIWCLSSPSPTLPPDSTKIMLTLLGYKYQTGLIFTPPIKTISSSGGLIQFTWLATCIIVNLLLAWLTSIDSFLLLFRDLNSGTPTLSFSQQLNFVGSSSLCHVISMGPHWKGTLIESENKNYKKRRGKRKKKKKKLNCLFW